MSDDTLQSLQNSASPLALNAEMGFVLRPYQRAACDALYDYWYEGGGNPIISLPTGCHARGTKVIMSDGSLRRVENIKVGDILLGPDSKPRIVKRKISGHGKLYRIIPKKGDSFIVNEDHVLSLVSTNEGKKWKSCTTGREIENIKLSDYLDKSKSWKHLRKLWSPLSVDFSHAATSLVDAVDRRGGYYRTSDNPIDPWFLGVLLGDGHIVSGVNITTADKEIEDEIYNTANLYGLKVTKNQKTNNLSSSFNISGPKKKKNPLYSHLVEIGVGGLTSDNKFIPDSYKTASYESRISLIAGLIDSDGHLGNGVFDFISKSKTLSEDLLFICRSVGLNAKMTSCHKYDQNGKGGEFWRVCISGDTSIIPTKIKRKQANHRLQKKRSNVRGFCVEFIGDGDFFGFELDSDHLYLTEDFIVHHNSGKSLVIATIIRECLGWWPGTRILVLTHVAELISQNASELLTLWPEAPVGIYSAGLNSRDLMTDIVFGGIQSLYRRAHELSHIDFVIIDEVHLTGRKSTGMYRSFLADLKILNPQLKVVGLSATPFRSDSGYLHEGDDRLFDDLIYEANVRDLIEQGYLCRPVSVSAEAQVDTTGVGTRQGDFIIGELEAAALDPETVKAVCDEIAKEAPNRKGIFVFGCGIKHSTMLKEGLVARGVSCATIFGDTPKEERRDLITRFNRHEIKALASVGVLTTGINCPHVDLLSIVRPTRSPVLYCQMVGRGLRNSPGKANVLVLDFGGNLLRHGPIDNPVVRAPKKKTDEPVAAPTKRCPECGEENPLSARWCIKCSAVFDTPERMVATSASTLSVISTAEPEWLPVTSVHYGRWQKEGKPDSIRVTYMCGMTAVSEWCCLWHSGPVRQRAERWWFKRGGALLPKTIEEALERAPKLRCPTEIAVRRSGKWFEIVGHRFAAVTDNVIEFKRKG